ncbi:MAG: hypothetical protein EDX89_06705 [Acidobacteria bacterium]|nr:MAG: hypothetical protein EDX89_06705 [Acidobacteriota bacterium]
MAALSPAAAPARLGSRRPVLAAASSIVAGRIVLARAPAFGPGSPDPARGAPEGTLRAAQERTATRCARA